MFPRPQEHFPIPASAEYQPCRQPLVSLRLARIPIALAGCSAAQPGQIGAATGSGIGTAFRGKYFTVLFGSSLRTRFRVCGGSVRCIPFFGMDDIGEQVSQSHAYHFHRNLGRICLLVCAKLPDRVALHSGPARAVSPPPLAVVILVVAFR